MTAVTASPQHVREFAAGPSRSEVGAFLANGTPPSDATVTQLAAYTGLPAPTWRQDFSMTPGAYRARLLPGQVIGRYDARVRVPGNSPLAIGGDPSFLSSPMTAVHEYDPVTDTWTSKADMPTARSGCVAGVVDGKI